jgi:hypothetical protein
MMKSRLFSLRTRGLIRVTVVVAAAGAAQLPAGALAAGVGPAAAKPSVLKFSLSRSHLPSIGGRVKLMASVRRARTCTFSSKPALAKLPATVRCATGSASKAVWLPANTTAIPVTYEFRVAATGPGGTARSRWLPATVQPAPPAVSGFAAAPTGLPPAGGPTTVTAAVERSSSCTLRASPTVAGLPVSFACPALTARASIKRSVSLPALSGQSPVTYTLTLSVSGPGGTVKSQTAQTVYPTMVFAAPTAIDPATGGLDDVSCASGTFCVAVDGYGNAVMLSGTTWSVPKPIDALPDGLVTGMSTAVSCPTTTFCAELAQDGDATFFNGSAWSKPVSTGLAASAVSCVSTTFCAAVGGSYTSVYDGSSWAAPTVQTTNTPFTGISCVSSTFCMAVNSFGDAFSYDGHTWSAATPFDTSSGQMNGVGCHSATLCVAVDGNGFASIYNGSTWSTPAKVVTGISPSGLDAVSCARSATYCLASASNGETYAYNGTSWGTPNLPGGTVPLGAVSCPSSSSCAVLLDNNVLTGAGASWKDSGQLETRHGFLTAVSCPSGLFCAATDWTNSIVTYNGTSWSTPQAVDPGGLPFSAISCTSPTFCVALEEPGGDGTTRYFHYNGEQWIFGQFYEAVSSVSCSSASFCVALASINDSPTGDSVYDMVWNGTGWSAPALVDSAQGVSPPPGTGYVSCVSRHFCGVVDTGGNALTFNGTSWSSPDTIDAGVLQPLDAISCPASNFCTAIDGFGQAFTFNGIKWLGPAGVEAGGGMTAISCASARFCAAVDESGNVDTYYDGTWSAPVNRDPGATSPYGFTGIACPLVSFCAAVDFEGNVVSGNG